jgi:hypothetical protein
MSIDLRTRLLTAGPYITIFTNSVMQRFTADLSTLVRLLVELNTPVRAAMLVTLKHRTLSPVVERFIACARELVKSGALTSGCPPNIDTRNRQPIAKKQHRPEPPALLDGGVLCGSR